MVKRKKYMSKEWILKYINERLEVNEKKYFISNSNAAVDF